MPPLVTIFIETLRRRSKAEWVPCDRRPAWDSQDFAGRDQAAGYFSASFLRQRTYDVARSFVPRQRDRASRKIGRAGDIEKGREQRLVAHFARVPPVGEAR